MIPHISTNFRPMSSHNTSFHHPAVPHLHLAVSTRKVKTKKSPTFCHPSLPGQHSLCEVESGGHCEGVAGGGDGGGGSGSSVLSETGAARRDVFRQLARNREKQTGREKSFFN